MNGRVEEESEERGTDKGIEVETKLGGDVLLTEEERKKERKKRKKKTNFLET